METFSGVGAEVDVVGCDEGCEEQERDCDEGFQDPHCSGRARRVERVPTDE